MFPRHSLLFPQSSCIPMGWVSALSLVTVIQREDFAVQPPAFQSTLCHLIAVLSWARFYTQFPHLGNGENTIEFNEHQHKSWSLLFTSLQEISERILETMYKHGFCVIGWERTGHQWISLVNWRAAVYRETGWCKQRKLPRP